MSLVTFVAAESSKSASPIASLVPLVAIVALFYFLAIRPQQKRARAQTALVAAIETGDRIETVAGMFGSVRKVEEQTVDVEIATGVVVTMAKGAVRRKVLG